jgi:hypothetical protein
MFPEGDSFFSVYPPWLKRTLLGLAFTCLIECSFNFLFNVSESFDMIALLLSLFLKIRKIPLNFKPRIFNILKNTF